MVNLRRLPHDFRENTRFIARLDCRFTCEDKIYDAVIVDLSRKGAMLISPFLPSTGKKISVAIRSDLSKDPLTLDGKVLRGNWVTTGYGRRGRFAVRFAHSHLDLMSLLVKLRQ